MIFHEAPHKLRTTLEDLRETFGPDRPIALCRELTKLHEQVIRTTLDGALTEYRDREPRGEYVLIVAGNPAPEGTSGSIEDAVQEAAALYAAGTRLKDAAREVAERTGFSKNELYQLLLQRGKE